MATNIYWHTTPIDANAKSSFTLNYPGTLILATPLEGDIDITIAATNVIIAANIRTSKTATIYGAKGVFNAAEINVKKLHLKSDDVKDIFYEIDGLAIERIRALGINVSPNGNGLQFSS